MSEIWDLSPAEVEKALEVGYTQAQVDAVIQARKANYEAIKEDVQGTMSDAEFATYYSDRYGIDHVCRCAEDKFTGNYVRVPECMLHFHEAIVDKVEALLPERDMLRLEVEKLENEIIELREQLDE